MDGQVNLETAPFRDARYAPRQLVVERGADGAMVLRNPTPFRQDFLTMTEVLNHGAATMCLGIRIIKSGIMEEISR